MKYRKIVLLSCLALPCYAQDKPQPKPLNPEKYHSVSKSDRESLLEKAEFWRDVDPEQVINEVDPRFPRDRPLDCTFVEPELDATGKPLVFSTGASAKFECKIPKASDPSKTEKYKVKYELPGKPGEARSEVAASLFAQSLGLYADTVKPVQVRCANCPSDPWTYLKTGLDDRKPGEAVANDFPIASIELDLAGRRVADPLSKDGKSQGWAWDEMDPASDQRETEFEALQLFATLLRHTDSKGSNQRLLCADAECTRTIAYISDLGSTFGEYKGLKGLVKKFFEKDLHLYTKLDLTSWTKHNVFKEISKEGCVGDVRGSPVATLKEPMISEKGRKFFMERLNKLYKGTLLSPDARFDDSLILKIFEIAKVASDSEMIVDPLTGLQRPITARDWTNAFNAKAFQIRATRCDGTAPKPVSNDSRSEPSHAVADHLEKSVQSGTSSDTLTSAKSGLAQ